METKKNPKSLQANDLDEIDKEGISQKKKGPLSFLSGALTSLLFAWISLFVSKKVVVYFSLHSLNYTSPFAQSISSAMKTLAIGVCFLATFTFAFIGLGLTIVFVRSLFSANVFEDD